MYSRMFKSLKHRYCHVLLLASFALCLLGLSACQTPPESPDPLAPNSTYITQQQANALLAEGFHATDIGWELGMNERILFTFGSDVLNPEALGDIELLGTKLRSIGITRLNIEGHTDNLGSDSFNEHLSLRRAQAVAKVLIDAQLFEQNSLIISGKGSSSPITDNKTVKGRQENRRVAIIVPAT